MKALRVLLVAMVILSFLAFPIPYDKVQKLNKQEIQTALDYMLGFFKTIAQCEKAEYVDAYQNGENIIFVIECKDAGRKDA